jgi:Xaa-Pro aminopeptidase
MSQSNSQHLKTAITESRVIKSELEISLMRHAAYISGLAHLSVMKTIAPGKTEREMQAVFEYQCLKNDAKHQAYLPIVAAGTLLVNLGRRGAVLHYGLNDFRVPENPNEVLIF